MKKSLFVFAGVLYCADRILKLFVLTTGQIHLAPWLILAPHINTHPYMMLGISSTVDQWMVILMPITHALLIMTLVVAASVSNNYRLWLAVPFVIVGFLSNAIDCVLYGGVIDPITFPVFGAWWTAINIADLCIMIGYVFLAMALKRSEPLLSRRLA